MKKLILLFVVGLTVLLSGCANHQIQLHPTTKLFIESKTKINNVVGYHISEQNLKKVIETAGGGGSKVTYAPYKDTESILFTVLSNKFDDVYLVKSLEDESFIKENEIKFIFVPEIITHSSSSSSFTWPPTKFTIDLTVKALNANGEVVWQKQIIKTGQAEFDEFKSDFSLSARRATEQAFLQLAQDIEKEISTIK